MARQKVRLADNIARVVFIETNATEGATLGTNLYLPSGDVATPATLAAWLGGTTFAAAQATQQAHKLLTGLSANDHPQYLLRATLTTEGDLLTRESGTVTRLGIGAEGQVLTVVGGLPAWAAPTGGIGGYGAVLLDELEDVVTLGVTNGDVLTYDSGSMTWVAAAPTGGGVDGYGVVLLDDLEDVATFGAADGDVLTYDSGTMTWIPASGGGGGSSDPLVLATRAPPATPAADTSKLFANNANGFGLPSWMMSAEGYNNSPVVLDLLGVYPSSRSGIAHRPTATSLENVGFGTLTAVGTQSTPTRTFDGTSADAFTGRRITPVSVTNNLAARFSFAHTNIYLGRQALAYQWGGGLYSARFNFLTDVDSSRLFVGLIPTGVQPSGDPSSTVNVIGVGFDTGDTDLYIMHNDSSGTCTKVNTGLTRANMLTTACEMSFLLLSPTEVRVFIRLLVSAGASQLTYGTTLVTDLPAASQLLTPIFWVAHGPAASGFCYVKVNSASMIEFMPPV